MPWRPKETMPEYNGKHKSLNPNMVPDEEYEVLVRDLQNLTLEYDRITIEMAVLERRLAELRRRRKEIRGEIEAKRLQIAQMKKSATPSSKEISSDDMVEYKRETDEEDIPRIKTKPPISMKNKN